MMHTPTPRSCAGFTWLLIASAVACGGEPPRVGAQREALLDADICISLFGAPCCSGDDCDVGGAAAASGAASDDSSHDDGGGAGQGGARDPGSAGGAASQGATTPDSPTHDGGGATSGEGGAGAVDAASDRAPSAGASVTSGEDGAAPDQATQWLLAGGSCSASAHPARGAWLPMLLAFAQVIVRRRARRRSAPTC